MPLTRSWPTLTPAPLGCLPTSSDPFAEKLLSCTSCPLARALTSYSLAITHTRLGVPQILMSTDPRVCQTTYIMKKETDMERRQGERETHGKRQGGRAGQAGVPGCGKFYVRSYYVGAKRMGSKPTSKESKCPPSRVLKSHTHLLSTSEFRDLKDK